MGCGSVLGDLFYLADSLIQSWPPGASYQARPATAGISAGRGQDLLARLYNMYGEGQISEQVFSALRSLAERGELRPADLAVHRARARRGAIGSGDRETANALRAIRSRLAQLAQARRGSERVLADLEARMARMERRMADKDEAARQALRSGDEERARLRLSERAELEESRARLMAQAQALRSDLERLDDLRTQLEAKAAELEAVRARGRLAEVGDGSNRPGG